MTYLRDVLFTCEPLVKGKHSDIPQRLRLNVLLHILSKQGQTGYNDLQEEILKTQTYRELITANKSSTEIFFRRWGRALEAGSQQGFISKDQKGFYSLTDEGRKELDKILARRETLFREGFDSDGG